MKLAHISSLLFFSSPSSIFFAFSVAPPVPYQHRASVTPGAWCEGPCNNSSFFFITKAGVPMVPVLSLPLFFIVASSIFSLYICLSLYSLLFLPFYPDPSPRKTPLLQLAGALLWRRDHQALEKTLKSRVGVCFVFGVARGSRSFRRLLPYFPSLVIPNSGVGGGKVRMRLVKAGWRKGERKREDAFTGLPSLFFLILRL